MAINGVINIYKEKGFTSHDVVAKLRGILKQKKIGHTGTLDPDAEGVLPVCLGNATKLCDMLTEKDKTYQVVLQLGILTDTQDMTGMVLEKKEVCITKEELEQAIFSFIGEYDQIPPMYSAIKVNGKKLYELAREGKVIERKARKVYIYAIDILNMDMEKAQVTMEVTCSKGTYIRTLCEDIGTKLNCGGCMAKLLRTKVSCFSLKESKRLEEVQQLLQEGTLMESIIPVETMFLEYGRIDVLEQYNRFLYNGNYLENECIKEEQRHTMQIKCRVYDSMGKFTGIYEWMEDKKKYKPVKMFFDTKEGKS